MISKDLLRHTKSLRILYVENFAFIRDTTTPMLQEYFDHLDITKDCEQGLERYKQFYNEHNKYYDIVFTSLELPAMSGIALCKSFIEFHPHQKIIVISDTNDAATLIELINLGVENFIPKPIQSQQLHEVITAVARRIYAQKLKEDEYTETINHNELLKRREDLSLHKLQNSLKTLGEFSDALNKSGIVSKSDINGNIIYVNDKFCTISGYTRKELIGKKHSLVKSDDVIPSFFEKLWNTITNKKSYRAIFKNKAKDGSTYYIEQLIKPIVNIDGEITEYIAIATDITQIMHSMELAKQAEQEKDDFFRNISHEMRTPLNSILVITSVLKERFEEDIDVIEMLTVAERNGQKLSALLESILDLQRIGNNQLELIINEFDTALLYTSITTKYGAIAKGKSLLFDSLFDANLPAILVGDAQRIQQIIMIVLDNAIKFTPKSGKIDFMLTYAPEDSLLICQIQDSGIGMSIEAQEKIFKLSQVDGSLSRKHEGSGLGLTIAHALMQKMNGTFTVYSIPGQGSTFMMEIPLKEP